MTEGGRDTKPIPLRPLRKCPLCGQPAARDTYPFCSKRCADLDLNRWLSGRYVIPAAPEDEATSEDGTD